MSPSFHPIPSRGALRALRHLALGGSTLLGAIGSACSIAALNCDTQRKVRLAERLIETKQTIRSVSNSNGAAHLAQMFEAAERGEDFGLGMGRLRRHSGYATLAKALEEPGINEEWSTIPQRPKKKKKKYKVRDTEVVKEKSPTVKHPSDEEHRRPRPVDAAVVPWTLQKNEMRPKRAGQSQHWDANSSVADRIIAASQQLHKPYSHTVYGRPSKKPLGGAGLPECVHLWLQPTNGVRSSPSDDLTRSSETETLHAQAPSPRDNIGAAAKPFGPGLPPRRPKIAEIVDVRTQTSNTRSYHALATQLVPETILQDQDEADPNTQSEAATLPPLSKRFQPYTAVKGFKPWGQAGAQRRPIPQRKKISVLSPTAVDVYLDSRASFQLKNSKPKGFKDSVLLSATRGQLDAVVTQFQPWAQPDMQQEPLPQQQKSSAPPARATDADPKNHASSHPQRLKSKAAEDILVSQDTWGQPIIQLSRVPNDLTDVDQDLGESISDECRINLVPVESATFDERFRALRSNRAFREEFKADFQAQHQERIVDCSLRGPTAWSVLFRDTYTKEMNLKQTRLWQDIVAYYALRNTATDWNVVQHMQATLFKPQAMVYHSYPIRLLTRFMVSQHTSLEKIAGLLFPLVEHETWVTRIFMSRNVAYGIDTRAKLLYTNADRYLRDLCREGCSVEEVAIHLRAVARAAKFLQLPLTDLAFTQVIRHFCERSLVTEAQIMFDEMRYYHTVQPTFRTRSLIILGYARVGKWEIVSDQLEALHQEDLSRTRVTGFSRLFSQVLRDYLNRHSVMQMHDYLVHALNTWGLVPTGDVVGVAMEAYLTQKRFDLARVLSHMARTTWPQIEFPTDDMVWHIGNTWERLRATCRDVEDACKAIFYGQHTSEFDHSLKTVAREALVRDLNIRLSRLGSSRGNLNDDRITDSSAADMETTLNRAGAVWAEARRRESIGEAIGQETRELIVQMESAERLTELFNTDTRILDRVSAAPLDVESGPRKYSLDPQGLDHPYVRFPTILKQDQLPPLAELEHVLEQYYNGQAMVDRDVNHSVLSYLGWKLIRQGRARDSLEILSLISGSPFGRKPHGRPFDLHILELWLKSAKELKSAPHCCLALGAAFDAGPKLELTQNFMLLVRTTINAVADHRFKIMRLEDPKALQELEWLAKRLHDRLDARTSKKLTKSYQKFKSARGNFGEVHVRPDRMFAPADGREANRVESPFTQVR